MSRKNRGSCGERLTGSVGTPLRSDLSPPSLTDSFLSPPHMSPATPLLQPLQPQQPQQPSLLSSELVIVHPHTR
jgi:hypothetical protein